MPMSSRAAYRRSPTIAQADGRAVKRRRVEQLGHVASPSAADGLALAAMVSRTRGRPIEAAGLRAYMRGDALGRGPGTAPGDMMLVTLMKAKLHRATVTQADLDYEGSIAIDRDLLDASGIFPHEQVDVLNITTGARFTTYAIEAPRGSRVIGVNGAAARLVQKGDKVIVVTYGMLPAEEARNYSPTVVLLDEGNEIKKAA
jgi:aspartate 1-decarboxylase